MTTRTIGAYASSHDLPSPVIAVTVTSAGTAINNPGATIHGGTGNAVSIGTGYSGTSRASFEAIVNAGTIPARNGSGVYPGANARRGAYVTHGATNNAAALIGGFDGINDVSANHDSITATIDKFGTIRGTAGGAGEVTNLSPAPTRGTAGDDWLGM